MEQRKERYEGARNVLVDPMYRAYPRSHRDRLQDLASPHPNPRHRCHAAAAAVAAPFAGVSSPSCSACFLCLSYASSLRAAAGSGPDGVAVGRGSGGGAAACVNSHELERKLHHVAADSAGGDGGDGVAVRGGSVHRLQPVAAEHGDVVVAAATATAEAEAACADSAPELERKLALVAGGMPLTYQPAVGTTVY